MRPNAPFALFALAAWCLAGSSALAQGNGALQTAAVSAPARQFQRFAARELQIRDAVAFVRVIPENRNDIAVAVTNGAALPAPTMRAAGGRLIIDGNMRRRVRNCRTGQQGRFDVEVTRMGWLHAAQIPTYEIHVPQRADVSGAGALRLHVGPAQSARVRIDGCGDADVEAVADEADVATSGATNLRLYQAGSAIVAIAGPGDITLGVVHSGMTASIAGAGDLTAQRVDGPTNIAVQGTGDVLIRGGRATVLSIAIAGAGDVTHNGMAERLDAAILGAGDVRVARVTGPVTRRVIGVGDIHVGR